MWASVRTTARNENTSIVFKLVCLYWTSKNRDQCRLAHGGCSGMKSIFWKQARRRQRVKEKVSCLFICVSISEKSNSRKEEVSFYQRTPAKKWRKNRGHCHFINLNEARHLGKGDLQSWVLQKQKYVNVINSLVAVYNTTYETCSPKVLAWIRPCLWF